VVFLNGMAIKVVVQILKYVLTNLLKQKKYKISWHLVNPKNQNLSNNQQLERKRAFQAAITFT
jgi:hypothetical protein